jgi:ATP-dependent Lon protease
MTRNTRLRKIKKDSDSESDASESETEWISESDESESDSESKESLDKNSDESYRPKNKKKHKKQEESEEEEDEEDDEEEDDEESDDDDAEEEEEEKEVFDANKFRKELSKLFPSKYMSEKVKSKETENSSNKKSKKSEKPSKKEKSEESEKSPKSKKSEKEKQKEKEKESSDKKSKKSKKSEKPSKKQKKEECEDDADDDESSDSDYDEEDAIVDESGKYSIILTLENDNLAQQEYVDDENEECGSDVEETFMKESYKKVEMPNEVKDTKEKKKQKEAEKKKKEQPLKDIENEYSTLLSLKQELIERLKKSPKNKIIIKAIRECRDSIYKLIKKARSTNVKKYYKMIYADEEAPDEIDYFKTKLSNKEQISVMNDLVEINKHIQIEKPYRLALLQSNIPAKFKATALSKLNMLETMESYDPEYHKIKNWVDTFMRIPFGIYKDISVNYNVDGVEKCHDFMENAKNALDNCVYGLDDAKLQILQMIGQWIVNPNAMGTAIAIKGPMGTGKTTLVKDGISKILGREFAFIALGGAGDSSFLEGHSYTYEGSTWGKIVQIIIDSKCMNPVIYFDELDKISDTPRGQEIIGILTHLTDTTQNSQFHDKYFSEVDFDLSKCLFIFSYNDESKVNSILKDRMYRIQTKSYDSKEKVIIARNYILPKIREQVCFSEEEVIIPDETLQYIISNKALTNGEDGVRNLKRCLEIIYTKINLFRLFKPGQNLFMKDMDIEVVFPFEVLKKHVDIFIKNEEKQNQSLLSMYC